MKNFIIIVVIILFSVGSVDAGIFWEIEKFKNRFDGTNERIMRAQKKHDREKGEKKTSWRKRNGDIITKIIKIQREIKERKYKNLRAKINFLASLHVDGNRLEDIATSLLFKKFPKLKNTTLSSGTTVMAIAFMCYNYKYFLNKIKIVRKDGRNMSTYNAIKESSPFNTSKIIEYLKISGAIEGIASADDLGGAMIDVFNAIDTASR